MKPRISHEAMGRRVSKEFFDGAHINFGGGLPSYAFDAAAKLLGEMDLFFHTENGALGYGRAFTPEERDKWDIDLMIATAQYVERRPGMCFFDHAISFNMIRGGHLDFTILGAYQVSEKGDLANWITPEWMTPQGEIKIGSVGGAMDLAVGAKKVIVMMDHTTKEVEPRILKECTYPITASRCVDLIFTDLTVIEVTEEGLLLKEIAPGWTVEEVQALTEPKLAVAEDLKEVKV